MSGNKKQYGYEQKREQINLVAHDKILTFENFHYLLEALEEYIEKSGYYRNFKNKRQFRQLTIKKTNIALYQTENLFRTKLLMFVGILSDDTPEPTKKEIREEFYKWIDIVGIDANNCPDEKLKHFLIEINNVIEGNNEKIIEQTQKYLDSKKNDNPTNPEDMEKVMKVFSYIQEPMDRKREEAEFYKNKGYFEVDIEGKLNEGSSEQGQQIFNQLSKTISNHDDFNFFNRQKNQQQDTPNENPYQARRNFIENITKKIKDWKVEEIVVSKGYFGRIKEEVVLINREAKIDYDRLGGLIKDPGNMYYPNEFSKSEQEEIKEQMVNDHEKSEEPKKEIKSECGSCFEYKQVNAESGLCQKCEKN